MGLFRICAWCTRADYLERHGGADGAKHFRKRRLRLEQTKEVHSTVHVGAALRYGSPRLFAMDQYTM